MELQEIEVDIDADGNVVLHVQGVDGMRCIETTAALEAALGEVVSRDYTPDAWNAASQQVQIHERGWAAS